MPRGERGDLRDRLRLERVEEVAVHREVAEEPGARVHADVAPDRLAAVVDEGDRAAGLDRLEEGERERQRDRGTAAVGEVAAERVPRAERGARREALRHRDAAVRGEADPEGAHGELERQVAAVDGGDAPRAEGDGLTPEPERQPAGEELAADVAGHHVAGEVPGGPGVPAVLAEVHRAPRRDDDVEVLEDRVPDAARGDRQHLDHGRHRDDFGRLAGEAAAGLLPGRHVRRRGGLDRVGRRARRDERRRECQECSHRSHQRMSPMPVVAAGLGRRRSHTFRRGACFASNSGLRCGPPRRAGFPWRGASIPGVR